MGGHAGEGLIRLRCIEMLVFVRKGRLRNVSRRAITLSRKKWRQGKMKLREDCKVGPDAGTEKCDRGRRERHRSRHTRGRNK